MDLKRFAVAFKTEEEYDRYLELVRWPDGIYCIYCAYPRAARTSRRAKGRPEGASRSVFQCGNHDCRKQFSVTSGTIFHKTHVPLSKWFRAITEVAEGPITTHTLQSRLQVSYQTAWYLRKRIREALRAGEDFLPRYVTDGE
jgi:transposase-like protein